MEELIAGGIRLKWSNAHFKPGTDSMVLADFVRLHKNESVCDLGCGCGTLMLLLAAKEGSARFTGVELQPEPAAFAAENVEINHFSSKMQVICGDLREKSLLKPNSFDCVVSNPPYYAVGGGFSARDESLALARSEQSCSLSELCESAARLLRFGGRFYLVHKPERLCDVLCALRQFGLEAKRLQFVRHSEGCDRSLMLAEARLGGKSGLALADDLILFCPDGTPTADWRRIYHQEA